MKSYSSPGRVITVINSGPGAVDVIRDQPYRIGQLVGVTQHSALVDAPLNLCVDGVYVQMVGLAPGVEAAEAGSPVLMSTGDWSLIAGVTSAPGHVPFGIVAERMTVRRVAQVKIMPTGTASGSGEGGTDPALVARVDGAETAILGLDERVSLAEQAMTDMIGAPASAEVTVIDITSPGTTQVTFAGLHNVNPAATQRGQTGAIKFNRHVHSSGDQLAALGSDAWLTMAKDGLYEIEMTLRVLDQSNSRSAIGYLYEDLQVRQTDGTGAVVVPTSRSGGVNTAAIADYNAEAAAQGQGLSASRNRGDVIWFHGPNAPWTDRSILLSWRLWLTAGAAIRVFGTMDTVSFYQTTQFAYGGVNAGQPADGTPDLRYRNSQAPTLRITRIAA